MARKMPRPAGYHWDQKEPIVINGRKSCRWCKGPVPRPRRTFCSNPCIHEWKRRTDWSLTRRDVFKRDKGVCARCSIPLIQVIGRIKTAAGPVARNNLDDLKASLADDREALAVLAYAAKHISEWGIYFPGNLWQADHIVPVSLGGDWFDLDNIQTLCDSCHTAKTIRENKSRARAARLRKRHPRWNPLLGPPPQGDD